MFLKRIKTFFDIKSQEELIKLLILSLCFFVIMGAYTLIREIKDAVFMIIVGRDFLPDIKILSWFVMVPLVFLYGYISERVKKHNILIIYSLIYCIGDFILSFLIENKNIGLFNNVSSPYRIFGWVFYLFLEGHSPFIVGVLWAFFNSISKPKDIKNSYLIVTFMGKLGGLFFAVLAWGITSKYFNLLIIDNIKIYSYILKVASILISLVPLLLICLRKYVSEEELMGYSEENNDINKIENKKEKSGGYGFLLLFKNPYVLGIFGMIFFWEITNVIFNYMRLSIALDSSNDILGITSFLYADVARMHVLSILIVLFGTSSIIRIFGERISLLLIPILIGSLVFIFLFNKTTITFLVIFTLIRSIEKSFSYPLRESLYIPTKKDIQFKSKSWIDSFGSKFSKMSGSLYNKFLQFVPPSIIMPFQVYFFILVVIAWTFLAYALGNRWEKAIKKKEIIG
jgi:AAA family ATP:ADP antiporter